MSRPARLSLFVLAGVAGAALSCGRYRPAIFEDAPAAKRVADDAPIPLPSYRELPPEFYLSDAYVRRTLVDALDARRAPDPGDVNAMDDVPYSSWFRPFADRAVGAPVPPLTVTSERAHGAEDAIAVTDARGVGYELVRDPLDRPEMRTSSAVIASRLVRWLGYLAPETVVATVAPEELCGSEPARAAALAFLRAGAPPAEGRYRVAAMRYPFGIDVGPTPVAGARPDDDNDRVEHRNRRTLRALKVVAAWLKITRLAPQGLRDVYVGQPGRGHLLHYVVGLDGALGADAVVRPDEVSEALPGTPLKRLVTLGLNRDEVAPTQRSWLALGEMDERVAVGAYSTTPPFEPMDRCTPADGYWIAKRIAALPRSIIQAAVDAGAIGRRDAATRLVTMLEARRAAVIRDVFRAVTALEVERFDGETLLLRDEAIVHGDAAVATRRYVVTYLDGNGAPIFQSTTVAAPGPLFPLRIPREAVVRVGYVVIRVAAIDGPAGATRAFEVHLHATLDGVHVVAVRH